MTTTPETPLTPEEVVAASKTSPGNGNAVIIYRAAAVLLVTRGVKIADAMAQINAMIAAKKLAYDWRMPGSIGAALSWVGTLKLPEPPEPPEPQG